MFKWRGRDAIGSNVHLWPGPSIQAPDRHGEKKLYESRLRTPSDYLHVKFDYFDTEIKNSFSTKRKTFLKIFLLS